MIAGDISFLQLMALWQRCCQRGPRQLGEHKVITRQGERVQTSHGLRVCGNHLSFFAAELEIRGCFQPDVGEREFLLEGMAF